MSTDPVREREAFDAWLKAKRDIAWAMKIAAKHNQNGPGCAHPPAQPALLDGVKVAVQAVMRGARCALAIGPLDVREAALVVLQLEVVLSVLDVLDVGTH